MLEQYLKYFWIYLEKVFFVFFEMPAFDVELMTLSLSHHLSLFSFPLYFLQDLMKFSPTFS